MTRYTFVLVKEGADNSVVRPIDDLTEEVEVNLGDCCENQEIYSEWNTVPSLALKPFMFPVTRCKSCGKTVAVGTHVMDRKWAKALEYFWNAKPNSSC